ncbi:hypothetical protein ABZ860_20850 [Microbispora sp. NPDC046973]|uniref:hypothetical protein n=1 Tax=Microbispora sp. NPDC046973 TaxID=3155022 RepID=UPI00340AC2FD
MDALQEALSRLNPDLWRYAEEPLPIRWIPLFQVTTTGLWLGLDISGVWVIGRINGAVATAASDVLSQVWVTILELEVDVLDSKLRDAVLRYELPTPLPALPIPEILQLALATRRRHWVDRALAWLDRYPASVETTNLLKEVSRSHRIGQANRHKAEKIIRRLGEMPNSQ